MQQIYFIAGPTNLGPSYTSFFEKYKNILFKYNNPMVYTLLMLQQ